MSHTFLADFSNSFAESNGKHLCLFFFGLLGAAGPTTFGSASPRLAEAAGEVFAEVCSSIWRLLFFHFFFFGSFFCWPMVFCFP